MNSKERFLSIMKYQQVDRMMVWDFGYWPETVKRWETEGLPENVDISKFLGIDVRWKLLEVKTGPFPPFEEEVIEEKDDTVIMKDDWGRIIKWANSEEKRRSTFPQFIEFPVKNRIDFKEYCNRLNPVDEGRYPKNWSTLIEKYKNRDYPLGIHIDGLFGFIRQIIGLENLSLLFYDDPVFVEEVMEYHMNFVLEYAKPILNQIELDFAIFWEDMAYNKGSLVSPELVRKLMLPRYKKITDLLHQYKIDLIWVDSDGTVKELIPIWLDAGINVFFPAEQGNCENRIGDWRKKYGKEVRIIGGIDKFEVAKGKKAIENQITKNLHLIQEGGFIPILDHSVPPIVSLTDYQYYLELVRNIKM